MQLIVNLDAEGIQRYTYPGIATQSLIRCNAEKEARMAQLGEFMRWTTLAGTPVTVNELTVTPLAQSLTLRWGQGGFVWNRPVAVLLSRDGQSKRVPIPDVTRLVQVILLGIVLLIGLVLFSGSTKEETQ